MMMLLSKDKKIKTPAIYQITSTNGKIYIGSSINVIVRIYHSHLKLLREGKHYNYLLQRHYNKYGLKDFQFNIIEFVHIKKFETKEAFKKRLLEKEQYWIDYYNSTNPKKGFNICPIAGSLLGRKQTEEEKERRRLIWIDIDFKKEVAQKMKESHPNFKGTNHPMFGKKHRPHKKHKGTIHRYTKKEEHKGKDITHNYPIKRKKRKPIVYDLKTRRRMSDSAKKAWKLRKLDYK